MITGLAMTACDPILDEELTGTVSIGGSAEVGQTLMANTANLNGSGTISYQWKRGAGGTTADIGIDSDTYDVEPADTGSTITVTVTRTGYYGSKTSDPTDPVADNRSELTGTDLRLPYYYPGTGKTYNGFAGTEGTLTNSVGGVTITYPAEKTFSADGFFTLEGSIDNPSCYNYAFVIVTKDSDPNNLKTTYLVRNDFKQRIWLRFGSGDYTITISGLGVVVNPNLDGEGDLVEFTYAPKFISLISNVTNTRNEGDMRFIYPSYVVQSDAPTVTRLAAELTSGLTDDADKVKAIHDYIILNTVYDITSTEDGMRKKQDAVTVLGKRYNYDTRYTGGHFLAVCEGYSNTFAALARAVGIETRYMSSDSMNHGWCNVKINGVWKFIDVTWDDPFPFGGTKIADMGPDYISYRFFLLDSLYGDNDGGKDSHTGWEVRNERSLINTSTLPRQRGVPDGWY
jgi:transglutaminase-like putative cysteine protease